MIKNGVDMNRLEPSLVFGTEAAYDRFQQLSIKKQVAMENEMASMNWDAWGAWGPWW
jgi:hypothetical protein